MNYKVGDIVKSFYNGFGIAKNYLYEIIEIRDDHCYNKEKCEVKCNKFKEDIKTFTIIENNGYKHSRLCEEDFVKTTDREKLLYYTHGTKALIEEDQEYK